jgi:outer membrane receptor protein involved in Fe transport
MVGDRHDHSFLFMRTVPNAARPTAITTDITVNPGYTVGGLSVDFRAARELRVFLRVNNLADTAYDSALGYPGSPRSVMVGARFDGGVRR